MLYFFFYSNPIRFWKHVHVENLNHKFFLGGQCFQRRSRCLVEPWHSQVTRLREKVSHLSSHGGSIPSCAGLFLNCAYGKFTVPGWRYGVSDVSRGYPVRLEQEVDCVCPRQCKHCCCVCLASFDYLQPHWWMANNWMVAANIGLMHFRQISI